VPELGLSLSYNVTPNLRLSAGYSILVLNHAVRAADQVDTTVNSSLLNSSLNGQNTAGAAHRPNFALEQSNPWVQTVNLGLEFRY
jgi:Putative beta barrel porin-7 (BBP7)